MKSTKQLLNTMLLLMAFAMFTVACGDDDEPTPEPPAPAPAPDLTVNIIGTYTGTYHEEAGPSSGVVNIENIEVIVSKLTDSTIMVEGTFPGLGLSKLFQATMGDTVQFSNPDYVFGDAEHASASGSLDNGTNLKFEILNPENPDYQATYDGEKN